jgi:single-strand DNA-binding protein
VVVPLEGLEFVVLRIEIIGNLGSEPEVRYTQKGTQQTTFRVAVNSRRPGADGESIERTDWFRVRVMGSRAEYVQRFGKGQRVLVVGRLQIEDWETREGEKRTSFDIWADDVVNLSPREDGARGQGEPAASSAPNGLPAQPAGARPAADDQDADLEDLPF